MSETQIILGLCGTIVGLGTYIASIHRARIKQGQEDKKSHDENTKEMTRALTMAAIAIENNTKVMQQNTDALNIVNYKR